MFHQLFEGLSLGIRIAALPTSSLSSSPLNSPPSQSPHSPPSLNSTPGGTTKLSHSHHSHSHSSPHSFSSSRSDGNYRYPHSPAQRLSKSARALRILKPTLSFLFAVTTPAGILIGMAAFRNGADPGKQQNLASSERQC